MKILLIGRDGQLGHDCVRVLKDRHDLAAVDLPDLDLTDPAQVEEAVRRHRPEAALNCAAFTRVDACETERDAAYAVNVAGPRNLAVSLARHGGALVHISTDYVFDGCKPVPEPYLEDDAVGPLSYYGRTKLEGELAISREMSRYLIVRTAWLYGVNGHNFLKTMLRLALRSPAPALKVVNDQFGSLTWTYRLAEQLARLLKHGGQGIYHAAAEGYGTWYEVATYFLERMGVAAKIRPCTTAEYPTPARRPRNSILENRRLKLAGINLMRPWKSDLEEFVRLYRDALMGEAAAEQ